MPDKAPKTHGPYADVAPTLDRITQQLLFGEVWERSELSRRDRSLITVATLVAQYRINELPFHLQFALKNGVTRDELVEVIRPARRWNVSEHASERQTAKLARDLRRRPQLRLRKEGVPRFEPPDMQPGRRDEKSHRPPRCQAIE